MCAVYPLDDAFCKRFPKFDTKMDFRVATGSPCGLVWEKKSQNRSSRKSWGRGVCDFSQFFPGPSSRKPSAIFPAHSGRGYHIRCDLARIRMIRTMHDLSVQFPANIDANAEKIMRSHTHTLAHDTTSNEAISHIDFHKRKETRHAERNQLH